MTLDNVGLEFCRYKPPAASSAVELSIMATFSRVAVVDQNPMPPPGPPLTELLLMVELVIVTVEETEPIPPACDAVLLSITQFSISI